MDQFNRRGGRALGALLALALAALPPASHATLPPAIDGQPLPSLAPMLQKVTPAVVNISTKTRVQVNNPYFDDPVFRQFFGLPSQPMERVEQSLGSGVIVDAAKGYVLTNNHVVGGADDIKVTLQDGRNFTAKLLGADPDTDVAVLQINASGLSALPLADSTKLRVGDFVVAVGDPFGLGQTVTSGIVSALGRSGLGGTGYQNFIQTDASINPGNSGGALVNLRGELVGINSMIFSPSGASAGIGFAIPSNLSAQVMRQLVVNGKVQRGSLGVETQDIDTRIAQALKLPDSNGTVVTRVAADSPAARAGLSVGDVITALDGKPVRSAQDLLNAQGLLPVDSTVSLSVFRNGASRTVSTKLTAEKIDSASGDSLDPRLAGVGFSDLTREQRSRGIYGAQVDQVQAGSRAARAGLQKGDIVIAVGNLRITNLRTLRQLAGVRPRQLVLVVASDDGVRYVVVN
jgi:serine protease Do/serine protease DegQ